MSDLNIADFNEIWLEAVATVEAIFEEFDQSFNEPNDLLQLAMRLKATPPGVMQILEQQSPGALDKIDKLFSGGV